MKTYHQFETIKSDFLENKFSRVASFCHCVFLLYESELGDFGTLRRGVIFVVLPEYRLFYNLGRIRILLFRRRMPLSDHATVPNRVQISALHEFYALGQTLMGEIKKWRAIDRWHFAR